MKTYLSTIIPKLKQYSYKLDATALLTNKKWHVFNDEGSELVYIFRDNNELLVSEKGKVSKGKWEFITTHTILIDYTEGSYLFNPAFFDDSVLALTIDGSDDYVFLLNRDVINNAIDSIERINEFLEQKYKDKSKTSATESSDVATPVGIDEDDSNFTELDIIGAIVIVIVLILFMIYA